MPRDIEKLPQSSCYLRLSRHVIYSGVTASGVSQHMHTQLPLEVATAAAITAVGIEQQYDSMCPATVCACHSFWKELLPSQQYD